MASWMPVAQPLPAVLRDKRVAVIGAGKVGTAMATLLREAGMSVVAITTRGADNVAAAASGDAVLVTTQDDCLETVVAEIARGGGFHADQLVAHMSGARSLSVLAPAADAGALVGCLHPLQSFATHDDAVRLLPGSVFGITPGPNAGELIEALVGVVGGTWVWIADADKPLYHAAAVVASNYLVAVQDVAVSLLMSAGFDRDDAHRALRPLMTGTAQNVASLGTTHALTGPIVRGDVETVAGHIEALRGLPGSDPELYLALGRRTLEIAERRGQLSAERVGAMRRLLEGPTAE